MLMGSIDFNFQTNPFLNKLWSSRKLVIPGGWTNKILGVGRIIFWGLDVYHHPNNKGAVTHTTPSITYTTLSITDTTPLQM